MSKLTNFVSGTIVLIFIWLVAATLCLTQAQASPSPQTGLTAEENDKATQPSAEEGQTYPELENLTLTRPDKILRAQDVPLRDPKYYPYQQQMTFRAGASSDFPKVSYDDTVLGFQYLFPKFLSPRLEAGADLHEKGRGHLHVGARWIYSERSYWRPSVKLAVDHFVDSAEGLATLARKEDWYLRGGLTAEYVVWNPYSLRLEQELLINFDNVRIVSTLGLSRGW